MIKLENVRKIFDQRGIAGLHDINIDFSGSKLFALMGPSGSGKTTLLKILSGTLPIDSGKVTSETQIAYLDSFTSIDRNKTMHQTLFDAITVTESEDQKIQLIRDMSMLFEMTGKLKTLVSELSAGQYQRLLLASFLINRPHVLLLDEPFSNLDESLRHELMLQLKELIIERDLMVIWVTHQSQEALSFADEIILLHHGSVEQRGSAQDLYYKPRSIFAAQFFGHTNLFAIRYNKDTSLWTTPWGELPLNIVSDKEDVLLVIPEEAFTIDIGPYEGIVQNNQFLGGQVRLTLEFNSQTLTLKLPAKSYLQTPKGSRIAFNIKWLECFEIGCL